MTIHPDHPFWPPPGERDPVRRFRGRLPAAVTVWAADVDGKRFGLTVSSLMIAHGDSSRVLALLDPDSDLMSARPTNATVNVLSSQHRFLAEVFAGAAPSPGGPFRQGEWSDSRWGPVLADAAGWLGVKIDSASTPQGYGVLVEAEIEHVEIRADTPHAPAVHLRGRYLDLGQQLGE